MINPNRQEQRSMMKPSERNGAKSKPTPAPTISKVFAATQSALEECEEMITSGFQSMAAGVARIKNERLYKEAGFGTFEDYCQTRWGWSANRAYKLAAADATIKSLPEECVQIVHNEGQARALAKVPEEKRAEVLAEVAESGPVTAKRISQAAEKNGHKAKPDKVIELDKTGYAIPDSVLELWNRADAFRETINQLSKIKVLVETGINEQDEIFREITSTTIATLKNAYGDLKRVLPHAVCTSCQGHGRKNCTLCRGRGFISEFLYSTAVPMQTKKIREAKK